MKQSSSDAELSEVTLGETSGHLETQNSVSASLRVEHDQLKENVLRLQEELRETVLRNDELLQGSAGMQSQLCAVEMAMDKLVS